MFLLTSKHISRYLYNLLNTRLVYLLNNNFSSIQMSTFVIQNISNNTLLKKGQKLV